MEPRPSELERQREFTRYARQTDEDCEPATLKDLAGGLALAAAVVLTLGVLAFIPEIVGLVQLWTRH
jgi:hypothetical protein